MATQFENLSSDLIWQVTRNNNAYLVKGKAIGGAVFSRDPYNLLNKQSHKYSGFASNKGIAINVNGKKQTVVGTKTSSKANKPSKSEHVSTFGAGKSARGISKSVVSSTAKKGYRTDLRTVAVARIGAIKKAQRPVREREPKPRGSKKSTTEA